MDENINVTPAGSAVNPAQLTPAQAAEAAAAKAAQAAATPADKGQESIPAAEGADSIVAAPAESGLVTPPPTEIEKVPSEPGEDGKVSYETTGDAGLDVALSFIGNLGINGEDPAVVAAANGNFGLLEAKLATMGDKAQGWQQIVALAKDAYTRSTEKYNAHVQGVDKAILAVAGSAENWTAIKNWAAANATAEEKAEINRMIDAGPVQARAAATLLLGAFQKAKGTIVNPSNPLRKNAGGESPTAENGKLSRAEYGAEVRKLHQKLGTRMESSPEYASLKKRLAR